MAAAITAKRMIIFFLSMLCALCDVFLQLQNSLKSSLILTLF
jgi:hypothetical protein